MCRNERVHPVTLEVAEATTADGSGFQARVRLDGIVFVDVGEPQSSETDALRVFSRAFDWNDARGAGDDDR